MVLETVTEKQKYIKMFLEPKFSVSKTRFISEKALYIVLDTQNEQNLKYYF